MSDGLPLVLLPFGAAVVSWPLAKFFGLRYHIMDYPDYRKIHKVATIRTGGLLILFGYLFGLLLTKAYLYPESRTIILSAVSIFALGLLEDKFRFGARLRLLFQVFIASVFVAASGAVLKDLGLFALPSVLQFPFTVFGIIGVINAFNIIDGMNGLSSGLGAVSAASLAILAYIHGDIEIFKLSILLIGAIGGFMIFNLRGMIFMGDSGSYLIGFMVASFSVMLAVRNPGISPFAQFLIVLVPVFDTVFAIWRRRRLKRDPLEADRRHLHHILARRYRSHARAVISIVLLQAAAATVAIAFHRHTVVLTVAALIVVLFQRRLWLRRIRMGKTVL